MILWGWLISSLLPNKVSCQSTPGCFNLRLQGKEPSTKHGLRPEKGPNVSTPNMTGQRLHRTMEMIPAPPVVPTCSQSLAVKDFYFMVRGICRGFFVKFLAANFSGNRRAKIGKISRQIFATFFAHVGETFCQDFALGAFRHNPWS